MAPTKLPVLTVLKAAGRQALRIERVRRAATAAAALRGHGLVLVFHTIDRERSPAGLVVPVPETLFREQIEALLSVGSIVPLEEMLTDRYEGRRPRFALTFDDDYPTHYEYVLPILRTLGVTATFFLSGRALHGMGPLWFERLDRLIGTRGLKAAVHLLGIDAKNIAQLAHACETDSRLQERIEQLPGHGVLHLRGEQIRALSDAGMTIGFHTLHHQVLSQLSDPALDDALTRGRVELEQVIGRPLRLFAYPYGKADERTAARVRCAGFTAACTGRPHPVRPGDDPYQVGRWEPGPIAIDQFVASVAIRLNDWSTRE
jgi:peptidoglycan/xylan/chitin deacetylase (PgdA/CDA1 family)